MASTAAPAVAVPEHPRKSADGEEPKAPRQEGPVEAASDAERVLRIEGVVELDRQKLAVLEADVTRRQSFFDRLADGIATVEGYLAGKRARLEEIGDTGDPAEKSSLEAEISKLENELELLQTQSELAFSSLKTVREQMAALEKKIEREQRALDVLTGVAPQEPAAQPSAATAPAAQPDTPPSMLPLLPGLPTPPPLPPAAEPAAPVETTAQIEALRVLERRQREAGEAQQALVEFVKRSESLEEQIALEGRLLETARGSVENLTRALESRRADLERASATGGTGAEVQRLRASVSRIEELLDRARREIDERGAYLDSLNRRLERLREEELSVTAEAAAARDAIHEARASLRWLQSPLHPENLLRWARERGPRILIVLVTLAALLTLLRLGMGRLMRLLIRRSHDRSSAADRADTLALSFRSAMTFLIVVGGIFLLLEEAGVDATTVLGGAAILGVAVAFGAQNLTRDYFTGFLVLLENQFELGDVVTIAGITGTVESVNMRVTVLRDLEGRVHFIPNGEIKSVTNRTYHWGRAVLEIPVGYHENVDHVIATLSEIARELRADPAYSDKITEDPVMMGVDAFTEYGVIIKFMVKTLPEEMFNVKRELLRRVKNRFDEIGIEISVPHRRLLQRHSEREVASPGGAS
jgi:small conductance mechanosensitive channel